MTLHFESSTQNSMACGFCGKPRGLHEAIAEVSPDKRSCKLLGFVCVADFDITDETIEPLQTLIIDEIRRVRNIPTKAWDLNIGLYAGGQDIRVWPVHHP